MRYNFLILVLFSALILHAQTTNIKVVYSFNNGFSGEIVDGSDFLSIADAVAGGSYLKNTAISVDGSESVLSANIVNNNATNYTNTFVRFNLTSKSGKAFTITKITVRQRANAVSTSNLFRIGCGKNNVIPAMGDINQSTVNTQFTSYYNSSSFNPGLTEATVSNTEILSVYLTGRGSSTSTVNWLIDEIEIEGNGFDNVVDPVVVVSDVPKQQMRFGIDAERLWYWRSGLKTQLAELAVKELQSDYVRVAINCAYEREQDVIDTSAYNQILEMMTAMKAANPNVKFFASERPLDQAYTATEQTAIFGTSDGCPWAPYPGWIMGFSGYGGVFGGNGFNPAEAIQYLADYLNFMNSKGFSIDYMDLTNEKQIITPAIAKYMYDNLPALLNANVKVPAFVVPSSWSRQQGTDWLKSVNTANNEQIAFEIASTHNTNLTGTPEDFVAAAKTFNKEVWNSELHGWVGIALRDEILNSASLWEHIRAGFSGIDSWLFFGPFSGKDHTMIWASTTQIIKSGKYEMFKKMVNNANRGYYLETTMPNANCMTTSFIKDSIMTIWALNKSSEVLRNVVFNLQNRNIQNKTIEVTKWNSTLSRQGFVSEIKATKVDNFTYSLDSASLYCFKVVLPVVSALVHPKYNPNITIFPNPVSNSFEIYSNSTIQNIELFNINGSMVKVLDSNKRTHSVSDLKNGLYFLKYHAENDSGFCKLIILN